jgi:hypothetical protein
MRTSGSALGVQAGRALVGGAIDPGIVELLIHMKIMCKR